jgi:hypothetical protein
VLDFLVLRFSWHVLAIGRGKNLLCSYCHHTEQDFIACPIPFPKHRPPFLLRVAIDIAQMDENSKRNLVMPFLPRSKQIRSWASQVNRAIIMPDKKNDPAEENR